MAEKVYQTLEALIANECGAMTTNGMRPYAVTINDAKGGKQVVYVVSNSPGKAAQMVCKVETVKMKDWAMASLKNQPKSDGEAE